MSLSGNLYPSAMVSTINLFLMLSLHQLKCLFREPFTCNIVPTYFIDCSMPPQSAFGRRLRAEQSLDNTSVGEDPDKSNMPRVSR